MAAAPENGPSYRKNGNVKKKPHLWPTKASQSTYSIIIEAMKEKPRNLPSHRLRKYQSASLKIEIISENNLTEKAPSSKCYTKKSEMLWRNRSAKSNVTYHRRRKCLRPTKYRRKRNQKKSEEISVIHPTHTEKSKNQKAHHHQQSSKPAMVWRNQRNR